MLLLALLLPFLGTFASGWVLLIAAVVAYFVYTIKKKQNHWKRKGIKYVKPKLFSGNLEIIRTKSMADLLQDLYRQFPKERFFGVYQWTLPTLFVKDPDLIKQITVKDFEHFINHRPFISSETDPFWSKNMFASRDEKWRDLRSTLSPSFTSSKMKMMYSLIDECAQQFVDFFKKENGDVIELEMKDTIRRYTNDVIATTAFGLKCNSLKDPKNDFYKMGTDASNFGGLRSLKFFAYALSPALCKLLNLKLIPENVADYFSKIITDTVQVRKEKHIVRPDMIHLLMEAQRGRQHQEENLTVDEGFSSVSESAITKNRLKKEITIDDICSQAFIFFLAGFETVSTFLNFAFYELAINPEIQNRLRQEIQAVSGKINYETVLKMEYLDMVVSEVLRKWPPAILTDREVTREYTIQPKTSHEKPVTLEEGTVCWLPIFAIHRDEEHYPDPEKFDPERFNEENKHKINPFAYMPFGAGPRNCIGSRFALLEGKLIIFHILKNFEIVRTKKTQHPVVLHKYQFNITAEKGMWLGLKKL